MVATWSSSRRSTRPSSAGACGVVLHRRGARRSELPSRSTGFTALPLTLVVAGLDVLRAPRRSLGLVGVVGHGVALRLQLGDRRLELRHRGEMLGSLMMLASGAGPSSPSSARCVAMRAGPRQRSGRGEDAPGERDVAGLDLDPGRLGEGLDDRQERVGGQRGRLVGVGVDDRSRRRGPGDQQGGTGDAGGPQRPVPPPGSSSL
jgi:hypothetical protein